MPLRVMGELTSIKELQRDSKLVTIEECGRSDTGGGRWKWGEQLYGRNIELELGK